MGRERQAGLGAPGGLYAGDRGDWWEQSLVVYLISGVLQSAVLNTLSPDRSTSWACVGRGSSPEQICC